MAIILGTPLKDAPTGSHDGATGGHLYRTLKRVLLGSTALIAAGGASAAEGVTLEIGGRYMGAAGIVFAEEFSPSAQVDDDDLRDYVFKQDVEVYFAGETVLDNGLTVGARIELEGQTSADQIDAVFAYVSGGFGELRFGDTGEALAQLCYLVPSASGIFGADSPNFNFSNSGVTGPLGPVGYGATNGTCYGVDDKSTKIVYFSPNFAGFSFAASFTPDDTEDTRNTLNGAGTRFSNDANENSENLSVAANFTRDFSGIDVVAGGGATWSFDRENDDLDPGPDVVSSGVDEREEYNAYARVGYAGFTLGGAYSYRKNTLINGADSQVYGAGITYNWDAWTVGLGWSHGDYEFFQPTPPDITDDYDIFSLTGSYALGPGIQIDAAVEYYDYKHDEEAFEDYQAIGVGIGTLISF